MLTVYTRYQVIIPGLRPRTRDNGSHSWQTEPGTVYLAVGRSYCELPLPAK